MTTSNGSVLSEVLVPPDAACAAGLQRELVELTDDLADELAVVRRLVDGLVSTTGPRSTPADLARRLYPLFACWLDEQLLALAAVYERLGEEQREAHGRYFRAKMRPFTDASAFLARTNARPRGYAGDSELMRMLYDDELVGESVFGRLLHRHPVQSAAAQAVRHRVGLVASLLRDRRDARGPSSAPLRALSLACGPARELRSIFTDARDAATIEVLLADQDDCALAEARDEVLFVARDIDAELSVGVMNLSVRDVLRGDEAMIRALGELDVIYSLGLFDYLNAAVGRRLVERLFALLAPGGTLLIGNFHVDCTTRTYLDAWMDWPLLYRTEAELYELSDTVKPCERRIEREPTGSQMFLYLTK